MLQRVAVDAALRDESHKFKHNEDNEVEGCVCFIYLKSIADNKNKVERYIYLIGTDLLSSELHEVSEATNNNTTKLFLDYKYNDIDQSECIYYRSDHFHFVKNNIPAIFYFNGVHEDYHKPTDTADKIEYKLLKDRIKLIFYTAWKLANRNKKIEVDKNVDYSELVNCRRYLKLYNL